MKLELYFPGNGIILQYTYNSTIDANREGGTKMTCALPYVRTRVCVFLIKIFVCYSNNMYNSYSLAAQTPQTQNNIPFKLSVENQCNGLVVSSTTAIGARHFFPCCCCCCCFSILHVCLFTARSDRGCSHAK